MNRLRFSLIISLFFPFCMPGFGQSVYDKMKSFVDSIQVIDSHSHQGMPWNTKHNLFDSGLYLHADLISAGMPEYPDSMEQIHDAGVFWDHTEEYLRFCRATSYYAQFIKNYQLLYGLEKQELTKSGFLKFSKQMNANFKNYNAWLDTVCNKLNIEVMFADRLWQAFDENFDTDHFLYVFRFDQLVLESTEAATNNKITNNEALEFLGEDEIVISDLLSYTNYIDDILEKVVDKGAVCLKMGLAYHRSLDFENVSLEDALKLFQKIEFSESDKKQIQDFIVFSIVKKATELNLPIQIHTGYLHGNYGNLERGQPMKLIPLIRSNPKTKFVLFHGAYPWTGEFVALGKNYPNVFLDIVWLPQISRTVSIRVLHEILDCVPYNKICWGGDVGYIDDGAGSLELGREVVATVLAERIEKGWLTKEVAQDIARRIFRENAIDIYALDYRKN